MSDEASALYRKEKTFRSSVVPSLVTFRSMKRENAAVDFDRVDLPRRIFQSLVFVAIPRDRRSPHATADKSIRICRFERPNSSTRQLLGGERPHLSVFSSHPPHSRATNTRCKSLQAARGDR